MRKLIESNHVSLGGEVGSNEWALPYLDADHNAYATRLLLGADMLLLGRKTYEGLSAAYLAMANGEPGAPDFVDRMNALPKYVASTTLRETTWNATVIPGDVASFVADLKQRPGGDIVKYGNGPLDATLMHHGLIDEFHLLVTPVATGRGHHLFEDIDGAPALKLLDAKPFKSGVVLLTYAPG
ncbi:MAG TPA: dihydrofolate reductase family protein [Acidimicrobiales bacterium]|jgi:dihydrofolate reductase|nr:dihydrofolate reductase family protein [Acidimicrobiales bacterium]